MDVLDLISDSDEEQSAAPVRIEGSRREGKKPLWTTNNAEAIEIDLEAATGVGLGVSGKPLLPAELEARQQQIRRSWTLTASRSTEDTPEEQHYRFAESAWCRGGGQAAQVAAIEYHFHPRLEARWHAKKAEYDERFGIGGHTILFAFHGTNPKNVEGILSQGFKLSKLGATTGNRGFFGAGVYFSEHHHYSAGYNGGNDGMFLCKLLVGKPYLAPHRVGAGLQPGYTSHVSDASGSEVVIFDEAAMLPCYVVKCSQRARSAIEPLKGLDGRAGAAGPPMAVDGAFAATAVPATGAYAPRPWSATVERAKSGRAKCIKCGMAIDTGVVRMRQGTSGKWKHLRCFKRPPLKRLASSGIADAAGIHGFSTLDATGRAQVEAWFAGTKALERLFSGAPPPAHATAAATKASSTKASLAESRLSTEALERRKLAAQIAAEEADDSPVVVRPPPPAAAAVAAAAAAAEGSSAAFAVDLSDDEAEDEELQRAIALSMVAYAASESDDEDDEEDMDDQSEAALDATLDAALDAEPQAPPEPPPPQRWVPPPPSKLLSFSSVVDVDESFTPASAVTNRPGM